MALFSLKKIAALAAGKQPYLRGVALYNAGAVTGLSTHTDGTYAEGLSARVLDRTAGDTFSVEVGFNTAGEAVYYACPCGAREKGACKHVVAALTHKYYRDMVADMPAAHTPPPEAAVTRRMLDGYWQNAQTAIRAATGAGATLIPTLHIDSAPTLTLSVCVEEGHPYVIKDIARFREQLAAGDEVTYGTGLTLVHHPEAFLPASRPLLSLVAAASPAGSHARRELPLTPSMLDRFFALYEGQTVPVGGRLAHFVAGDPPLTVDVTATDDGATLRASALSFAFGEERLYLLQDNTLYAATPAFTAAVRGLLQALRQTGGVLPLTGRELAEFCGRVLPQVEGHLHFAGDTGCFDPYRPLPLTAAIYLDFTESGEPTLTARVEFRYGERLFAPGDNAPDEARDPLAEWRVLAAVSRLFPRRLAEGSLFARPADDESLFDFLTDGLPSLTPLAVLYTSESLRAVRVVPPPRMAVGVRMHTGLLELDLDLGGLDKGELAALLASYRARKRYHRLRSGQFLSLDDGALLGLSRLSEGLGVSDRQLQSGRVTVPAFRAPFVDKVLSESRALGYTRDEATRALLKAVKTVEDSEFELPDSLQGTLRGYQRTGFRWLRTMEHFGFGGILADDMGLGKTVQMITLLLDAKKRGVTLPSLVVCPASLVLNWQSE
ncbi:MAG: SNF2 helicase associated domain-containing protein, partial [Clostridia bacterium]|nr:SNF2 helicase associated domain-containing protein [Clostridia bacterium]